MNHVTVRRRNPLAVLLATILVAIGTAAAAADYYVSTTGSDSASGSSSAPWRTLQRAADAVRAGDVVHVAAGSYTGFYLATSGTAASPITFRAAGPNVILNQPNNRTPDCVNLEGASYVTVEGFIVEDSPRVGLRAVLATGVVFRNNTIRRSGLTGILTGYTPRILIENNVVSGSMGEHGIYVSNSDVPNDDPIIRGNECFGNYKNGIQLNGDCDAAGDGIIQGALVENNIVHDNNWKGFSIISTQGSIFQNNLMYDNGITAGAGGIHFADEPGCGRPSNQNLLVNNTIIEPRIACVRMTDGSTGNVVFNNICVAPSSSRLIVDEAGGNLIDASSNITVTTSTGLFVNAAGRDLHLASGSAAINAGIPTYQGRPAPAIDREGASRPAGSRHDAGAYEAGSAPPEVDIIPPTAAITQPAPDAVIDTPTLVSVTATDNVRVARVEFLLDGSAIAGPDITSPYTATLDPSVYATGFYTLTARAFDDAGNVGVSPGVPVFVRNDSGGGGGIPAGHPRLWLLSGRLAELRGYACYDNAGNRIPNCTPTAFASAFFQFVDTSTKAEPWHYALAYMISGRQSYATQAISEATTMVNCDWTCVANAHKHFLYVRDYMRSVCLVYDWLYDQLTPQQRASYVNYMNKLMYLTWNDTAQANAIYDTSDWSTGNGKNNFFYNYLLAATYVGLATYGENPRTFVHNGTTYAATYRLQSRNANSVVYDDLYDLVLAKLSEQAFPVLDTIGAGGGWIEGENYGRASKRHLFEAYVLLAQTAGVDYFKDPAHPFAREAVRYQLYTTQPGGRILYSGGDASQDPALHVNAYDRHLMLLAAHGLRGTPEGAYAQYYCQNVKTNMSDISVMIPSDFLLDQPAQPARDYSELRPAYFAPGIGWINSRSSWASDAISVTFVSTDCLQGHQHRDQNHFTIYTGGASTPVNGWMLTDVQPYSSTLPRSASYHNTILVDNTSQRFEEGTGELIRTEVDKPGYVYALGDASDAYWTNPGGYGHGDEKLVDVYQRELVHILPGYVVAFDRISLASKFATVEVKSMFHFPYTKPTQSGGAWMATSGPNRLFQQILTPETPLITWVDENTLSTDRMETWRMELSHATRQPNYQFLNVFYATRSTVAAMPATARVTSTDGNMVGAVIKDPAQEHVVMFSADPSGLPPGGNIIYQVGFDLRSRQMLFDLVPLRGYAIDVAAVTEGYRITVSEGGPHETSAAGSLVFTIEDVLSPSVPVAAAR